jgi:ribosomal protein S18 acetylase RimI-like enzyme
MAACHPAEPCWYLPQIAADPARQGQGLGRALLAHVIGEIQAGTSPVMYPMIREARR